MKYSALLFSVVMLGITGCQQTPDLTEQYEPAFAADDFGTEVKSRVSEVKSQISEDASDVKSAMKDSLDGFKESASDFNDEVTDLTEGQFEPMDE